MNCKPGDLAVVVLSDVTENLGLFVEVIESYSPDRTGMHMLYDGQVWLCRAKGVITYRGIFGDVAIVNEGPIPDDVLRPIRPEPKNVITDTEHDLEVTA